MELTYPAIRLQTLRPASPTTPTRCCSATCGNGQAFPLVTAASLRWRVWLLYRINELPFHLKRALENGLSREELIEVITHLAFYAGWPTASTALPIAKRVFDEAGV